MTNPNDFYSRYAPESLQRDGRMFLLTSRYAEVQFQTHCSANRLLVFGFVMMRVFPHRLRTPDDG